MFVHVPDKVDAKASAMVRMPEHAENALVAVLLLELDGIFRLGLL